MRKNLEAIILYIPDKISLLLQSNTFRKLLFYFILIITASLVFAIYVKDPGIDGYYTVMYEDMIYGKAYKPFVTRTLLPTSVRLITSVIPEDIKQNLSDLVKENSTLNLMFQKLSWYKGLATEYIIGLFLMFLSLIGFSYAVRILLHDLYNVSETFGRYFQVTALICLPPFFKYYSHIYDFPSLLLFTAGLIFLYRKKWNYFFLIFLISCFNKETTILLTIIFLLYYYRSLELDSGTYIKLVVAQIAIFIFSRILLLSIFSDNPGGIVEHHFIGHNTGLLKPYTFVVLGAVFFFVFLVLHSWTKKPLLLRRGIIIFPLMVILALFFGFLDEYRAYYEAYPVLLLLMTYSFADLAGIKISVKK